MASNLDQSFIIATDSFSIRNIWEEIESLDGKIDINIQFQMFLSAHKLLERSILWLLRNQVKGSIGEIVAKFKIIADQLKITEQTVKIHLNVIFKILNVSTFANIGIVSCKIVS